MRKNLYFTVDRVTANAISDYIDSIVYGDCGLETNTGPNPEIKMECIGTTNDFALKSTGDVMKGLGKVNLNGVSLVSVRTKYIFHVIINHNNADVVNEVADDINALVDRSK